MKTFNQKLVLLWLLIGLLGAILASGLGADFVDYFKSVRNWLFTAMTFLTTSLFATRTTWLAKLKEAYETEEHEENVRALQEIDPSVETYSGYARLDSAIYTTSWIALLTAALQVSLGAVEQDWTAGICTGTAVGVAIIFGYLLHKTHRIQRAWLRKIQKDRNRSRDAGNSQNKIVAAVV